MNMTHSMTGYASHRGETDGWRWVWDVRSVNGRGLDIRLRVPDWIEGLEPMLRETLRGAISRGSVTLSLRLQRDTEADQRIEIDAEALTSVLSTIHRIEAEAKEAFSMSLQPVQATDILPLVRKTVAVDDGNEEKSRFLVATLKQDVVHLLEAFTQSRKDEGLRLAAILNDQVTRVADLTADAEAEAQARADTVSKNLRANLARVLENADGADENRVAQELALIAVKADITEEIDRLKSHVVSARDLLRQSGPVGRKLDFLTQEFNREANTLCSKSQSKDLTRIGLDLKAVIDQMREQVQNVE